MLLHTIFPLVNWGMGTALIIVFALVCVGLSVLVITFVMKGKSKEEYLKEKEELTQLTSEAAHKHSKTNK